MCQRTTGNGRLLALTGRLAPIHAAAWSKNPTLEADNEKAMTDAQYPQAAIDTFKQYFGLTHQGLSQTIANSDLKAIAPGSLAAMAMAFGSPPSIFLGTLRENYTLPRARNIGGKYYVTSFKQNNVNISYYDCVRYAFLFASHRKNGAAKNVVRLNFDCNIFQLNEEFDLFSRVKGFCGFHHGIRNHHWEWP